MCYVSGHSVVCHCDMTPGHAEVRLAVRVEAFILHENHCITSIKWLKNSYLVIFFLLSPVKEVVCIQDHISYFQYT